MAPDDVERALLERAEALRLAVGGLVRAARTVDTLPTGEAATLALLERHGPLTIVTIAHRRGVRHQSVAKTVTQLTTAGLVVKQRQPGDGRVVTVHLTTEGHELITAERTRRARWLAEATERLDDDQQTLIPTVINILQRLADS